MEWVDKRSIQKVEMDLHNGSRDLTVPSIMLMRLVHGTLLFSGKPPGRPPDLDLVRYVSQHDAP